MPDVPQWRVVHLAVGLTLLVVGPAALWSEGARLSTVALTLAGIAVVGTELVRRRTDSGGPGATR